MLPSNISFNLNAALFANSHLIWICYLTLAKYNYYWLIDDCMFEIEIKQMITFRIVILLVILLFIYLLLYELH